MGRETYNLTALELAAAFGKEEPHIPEEHMNFQFAFGMDSIGNQQWSQWTCCRSALKIKSRKRTIGTRIELEYSKCWNQYCAGETERDVEQTKSIRSIRYIFCQVLVANVPLIDAVLKLDTIIVINYT